MPSAHVTAEAHKGYNDTRTMRELARELIETAILALLIFLALQFSIQNFRVQGSSMEPTLWEGQYIIVNRLTYLNFAYEHLEALLPIVDCGATTGPCSRSSLPSAGTSPSSAIPKTPRSTS